MIVALQACPQTMKCKPRIYIHALEFRKSSFHEKAVECACGLTIVIDHDDFKGLPNISAPYALGVEQNVTCRDET